MEATILLHSFPLVSSVTILVTSVMVRSLPGFGLLLAHRCCRAAADVCSLGAAETGAVLERGWTSIWLRLGPSAVLKMCSIPPGSPDLSSSFSGVRNSTTGRAIGFVTWLYRPESRLLRLHFATYVMSLLQLPDKLNPSGTRFCWTS
jgi:hypothetical protein